MKNQGKLHFSANTTIYDPSEYYSRIHTTVALIQLISSLVHTGLQILDLQEIYQEEREEELTTKGVA